jgi:hypothetical protein
MFRLDYVSCLLTVVATFLVGRKLWSGLVISGINSVIVCVIGLRTEQFGFIPANLFCICIYAFSIRAWLKEKRAAKSEDQNQDVIEPRQTQIKLLHARTIAQLATGLRP